MSLTLFNLTRKWLFREIKESADSYGHTFGGDPSEFGLQFVRYRNSLSFLGKRLMPLPKPLHLLYRLNLRDLALPIRLPGISWLPLCYSFGYSAFDGKCIYRVLDDLRVELIRPDKAKFDSDFPVPKYQASYPRSSVRFQWTDYNGKKAEDALSLAAVFGVDKLPTTEMDRAIQLVRDSTDLLETWGREPYCWEPEHVIRTVYPRPFRQGAPSRACRNPHCSAEVIEHTTATTLDPKKISAEARQALEDVGIDQPIHLPCRPVRRDSLTTFALYESEDRDSPVLNDIQLIFQLCDACECITVTSQCD